MLPKVSSAIVILVFARGMSYLPTRPRRAFSSVRRWTRPIRRARHRCCDVGDPAPTEFELNVAVRQGDFANESGGVFSPRLRKQVVASTWFGPFTVRRRQRQAHPRVCPLLTAKNSGCRSRFRNDPRRFRTRQTFASALRTHWQTARCRRFRAGAMTYLPLTLRIRSSLS